MFVTKELTIKMVLHGRGALTLSLGLSKVARTCLGLGRLCMMTPIDHDTHSASDGVAMMHPKMWSWDFRFSTPAGAGVMIWPYGNIKTLLILYHHL